MPWPSRGRTGSRLDPALDEVLSWSSKKLAARVSLREGVFSPPMIGEPENVVRDCVGVTIGDPIDDVPLRRMRRRRASAKKMRRPKPRSAMTPTVMEEMVAMPMLESRTDLKSVILS